MLFVRTRSIVPGIVFHFLFNSAGVLATDTPSLNIAVVVVAAALYLVYLLFRRSGGEAHSSK
jgi:membrane protease YdiL (CAAX protease family)